MSIRNDLPQRVLVHERNSKQDLDYQETTKRGTIVGDIDSFVNRNVPPLRDGDTTCDELVHEHYSPKVLDSRVTRFVPQSRLQGITLSATSRPHC